MLQIDTVIIANLITHAGVLITLHKKRQSRKQKLFLTEDKDYC